MCGNLGQGGAELEVLSGWVTFLKSHLTVRVRRERKGRRDGSLVGPGTCKEGP